VTSVVNVVLIIYFDKPVPVLKAYILEPTALASIAIFTYANHTRTRRASTILLVFWPLYFVVLAIWYRTSLAKDQNPTLFILALRGVTVATGAFSYIFECMGPEIGSPVLDKTYSENPVLTASIYSVWVRPSSKRLLSSLFFFQLFSWMTPLMKKGATQFITEEDLPPLTKSDESAKLGEDLKNALKTQ